jgi:uncharacterized protein YjbJ (UPF0337 family)
MHRRVFEPPTGVHISENFSQRRMNMNKDILKGKLLEIKGMVKEKWGRLTDDDLLEIKGKNERLFGLLQKKYGCIRDKAELEYNDSVELAEIVGRIREIMHKKNDIIAIRFIARYGQPLLGKKQEGQMTGKESKPGYDTDRYSYSRLSRRTTKVSSQ